MSHPGAAQTRRPLNPEARKLDGRSISLRNASAAHSGPSPVEALAAERENQQLWAAVGGVALVILTIIIALKATVTPSQPLVSSTDTLVDPTPDRGFQPFSRANGGPAAASSGSTPVAPGGRAGEVHQAYASGQAYVVEVDSGKSYVVAPPPPHQPRPPRYPRPPRPSAPRAPAAAATIAPTLDFGRADTRAAARADPRLLPRPADPRAAEARRFHQERASQRDSGVGTRAPALRGAADDDMLAPPQPLPPYPPYEQTTQEALREFREWVDTEGGGTGGDAGGPPPREQDAGRPTAAPTGAKEQSAGGSTIRERIEEAAAEQLKEVDTQAELGADPSFLRNQRLIAGLKSNRPIPPAPPDEEESAPAGGIAESQVAGPIIESPAASTAGRRETRPVAAEDGALELAIPDTSKLKQLFKSLG